MHGQQNIKICNAKCRVHSRLPIVPNLSQMNPVHILPTPVVKILFKATSTRATTRTSSKYVPTGTPYSFLSFPYFTTSLPFHTPQTDHPSNIRYIKCHEIPHYAISSTSCQFLSLRYIHSLHCTAVIYTTFCSLTVRYQALQQYQTACKIT